MEVLRGSLRAELLLTSQEGPTAPLWKQSTWRKRRIAEDRPSH